MKLTLTFARSVLSWGVLLLFFGVGLPAWAKPQPTDVQAANVAPKQASMLAASLQSFMPQPQPINLRGASPQESLSLPISPRLQIRGAVLHLIATSSVSLLSPRSQLQVRLDGQVIAQIALDPKLPQITARIDLPASLLTPGYHRLTFAAAQHYTNECEDPSAAELWTQIDTAQSWITLDGSLRDVHPTLSKLDEVFDPKLWGSQKLTVLSPGAMNPDVLRWGALAAQAVALRLGYVPLQVRYAQAMPAAAQTDTGLRLDLKPLDHTDAVLIGTRQQLQPYLPDRLASRINGPFLAVEPLGQNSGRYLLIASGVSAAQVDVALRTANLLDYPYPDTVDAVVKSLELPALPNNPGPRMVYPNQAVPFSRLGFRTANFSGLYGQQELEFTLPPDLFAPDNALTHLKLRFAYGAGLREDSVLNVLLNGKFQAAIALSARDGGYFRDYDVPIPLTSFKPGRNVLSFSAAMMPLVTGRCIAINTENLRLTLFADSRLELPDAAHIAALPNLDLFARTGFPYTRKAYGAGDVFAIPRADGAQAAAAWMLAAKLAQVQKLPLLDARWQIGTAGLSAASGAFVVGLPGELPKALRQALPLRLGATSEVPYPLAVSAGGPGALGPLGRLQRWLAEKFQISASPILPTTVWTQQSGTGLGRQAALLQARLPNTADGTLTVLTASQAAELLAQTDALIQPAVWDQLGGDLVLWHGEKQLANQTVGSTYTVGEAPIGARVGFLLSVHPWFWAIIVGVLSLLLAAATLRLLLRFYHRRQANKAQRASADDQPPLV
ncbi:MAG: cellulose biosynthesis cyclic di-GMP-binding regulatory protein BcsB [Thiomonas sp.]